MKQIINKQKTFTAGITPLHGGLLGLLLLLTVLAGCSDSDEYETPPLGSGDAIAFNITIGQGIQTRVTTGVDFKSTFEERDAIGIFAVKRTNGNAALLLPTGNYMHNVKLTLGDDAKWTSEANYYYPLDGDVLDFYAYYPYNAAATNPTNIEFKVLVDQSSTSDYSKSDLLSAKKIGIAKGDAVDLQFAHQMALVQIRVKQGLDIPLFDNTFSVRLTGMQRAAKFNWTTGITSLSIFSDIVMHRVGTTNTYRALIPAQEIGKDKMLFDFKQTTTGKNIELSYTTDKASSLTAGKVNFFYHEVTLPWIDTNHIYAEGDVYPYKGEAIGVVFITSNEGKNGKIIGWDKVSSSWSTKSVNISSVDFNNGRRNMNAMQKFIAKASNNTSWEEYPAFNRAHSKNPTGTDYSDFDATGIWYLPSGEEVQILRQGYGVDPDKYNKQIVAFGGIPFHNELCWTSTEFAYDQASYVSWHFMGDQLIYAKKTRDDVAVRCMLAF